MQSEITLGQVFQGVESIVKDHNKKKYQNKITEICMKQGCTQPKILCGVCKILHNDHREHLVSIAEIEEEFIQFKTAQQNNENELLQVINEFEQFARNQLQLMVKNLRMLFNPYSILENLIMKNKQQSYHQLKDQISELVKLIEFDNFKVKFKQIDTQEIYIQINNLTNQYIYEIENFIQQNRKLNQPIIQQSDQGKIKLIIQQEDQQNIISEIQVPKINDFYFSKYNCGKNIRCFTPNCVKNYSNEGFSLIQKDCLVYFNRNLVQGERASSVFKINSIEYPIGIGISQYPELETQFYNFTPSKIYQANSTGMIINSDYENYNNKSIQNFQMNVGEKYRFTFDPDNKERKQFILEQVGNSANKVTMPIKIVKNDQYRVFVYLSGRGSEIELID